MALAIMGSIGIVLTSIFLGIEPGSPASRALGVLYMVPPGIAAVLVQGPILRQPIMETFGFRLSVNRWFLWASFLPVIVALLSLVISQVLLGIELAWTVESFIEYNLSRVPEGQVEEFSVQIQEAGAHPLVRLVLQGIIFGLTVGLFVTMGEEVAWRGFLHHHTKGSFVRRSLVIGALWGAWSIPWAIEGGLYADSWWLAIPLTLIWALVTSPLIHYCRMRTNSVFAACIFRGTLMAMTQLPFSMTQDASVSVVGLQGVSGILASALVLGALVLYDRKRGPESLFFPTQEA